MENKNYTNPTIEVLDVEEVIIMTTSSGGDASPFDKDEEI